LFLPYNLDTLNRCVVGYGVKIDNDLPRLVRIHRELLDMRFVSRTGGGVNYELQ
jgi:hypothetical protein